MFRFYLCLVIVPFLIFTAALLIRAQPYDDHELRQLLLPEGCPAPCFMDIRPGVTTVKEAILILEASGWVKDIHLTKATSVTDGETFISVRWIWNEKQSRLIDSTFPGYLISYEQDIRSAVDEVHISTAIASGFIQLILQFPTAYDIPTGMPDAFGKIPFGITIIYDKVEVSAHLECPLKMRDM